MSIWGVRLKNLRDITGQTQLEIGKALGRSREAVKKYEKGERQPDLDSVAKLAKHFDISADYILGITDVAYSPGGSSINFSEYKEFNEYFNQKGFIEYVRLAVKMFIMKIKIEYIERFIEDFNSEK